MSSLVPHAVLLMPVRAEKYILMAQQHWQKAIYESRLGHLWSSTLCFWVVHECNFHIQAKSGFQWMHVDVQFSQRWSHISESIL